ncbi:hypothetical protein HGRIS_006758 [Hohenbuehelia grisea]|uniref:Cytochrome P450 n=1 Tax=Hohenbuehelia grisea TaxID=104357 RepID=A0ABR3JBH8_9AGAR
MKDRLRQNHAVDFQDLMGRFTLDASSEFLFGTSLKCLSMGLPYPHNVAQVPSEWSTITGQGANRFMEALANAQQVVADRHVLGIYWPLTEIFEDKALKPMKVVSTFIDPLVRDAIKRRKEHSSSEKDQVVEDHETLLDHMTKVTADEKILKDETLNIMIAGRDTSTATLTMAVYFLTQYPEAEARLRHEILTLVGPTRQPTFEDIKDMKYLRAVINETLRLYPPVPLDVRAAKEDVVFVSPDQSQPPLFIPAGATILYSLYMMQRRPDLWGPDAEEFSPERFLDERLSKYLLKKPWIFLPFSGGPRICLGQQFAYNEMSCLLIRLLQTFSSLTLDADAQPPDSRPPAEWAGKPGRQGMEKIRPMTHLTLYSQGGLWIKATENISIR